MNGVLTSKGDSSPLFYLKPGEGLNGILDDYSRGVAVQEQMGDFGFKDALPVFGKFGYSNSTDKVKAVRLSAVRYESHQLVSFSDTVDDGLLKLKYGDAEFQIDSDGTASDLKDAFHAATGLSSVDVTGSYAVGFLFHFHGVLNPLEIKDNSSTLVDDGEVAIVVTVAEQGVAYALRLTGNQANKFEDMGTSNQCVTGEQAVKIEHSAYETLITSGGTEGSEDVVLGQGLRVGQRRLISLSKKTHADDEIAFDVDELSASITLESVVLSDVGQFLLVDYVGGGIWSIVGASSDVITEET